MVLRVLGDTLRICSGSTFKRPSYQHLPGLLRKAKITLEVGPQSRNALSAMIERSAQAPPPALASRVIDGKFPLDTNLASGRRACPLIDRGPPISVFGNLTRHECDLGERAVSKDGNTPMFSIIHNVQCGQRQSDADRSNKSIEGFAHGTLSPCPRCYARDQRGSR